LQTMKKNPLGLGFRVTQTLLLKPVSRIMHWMLTQ
jgi:hypothetical protein